MALYPGINQFDIVENQVTVFNKICPYTMVCEKMIGNYGLSRHLKMAVLIKFKDFKLVQRYYYPKCVFQIVFGNSLQLVHFTTWRKDSALWLLV